MSQQQQQPQQPIYHGLIAGGCAAVASRVFTLPPDTIKARLQVGIGLDLELDRRASAHRAP
jgi:hypothetical protein